MNRDRREDYFDWLYGLVCMETDSYRDLLSYLHSVEFTYLISMDVNRAKDGIDLRDRYGLYYDGPCSVLEMMVALAVRIEETIMDNPGYGDRTRQWFFGMISSLGLNGMTDRYFDIEYVDNMVSRFLLREFEPNGKGGLFTIRNCDHDMRDVDIWISMLWYLNSIDAI